MRAMLCVLLAAVCAMASEIAENEARGSKRPYVADAVGNTLPPPSNLPATVGSPVNLITPDRYEFYTFDESGELVKRLMTLEEIQAIVAAGEEAEGLVTFANDNQPTIAFNFSQPPYTKVHNVVTNVQNVLKAQMEAHKNKPHFQPTLDTPDVSDSWSLILPSIFGNTGVDIVPDKVQSTGTFTTPETETIELDNQNLDAGENMLSKEGNNKISVSTMATDENVKAATIAEKVPTTMKDVDMDFTTTISTTTLNTPKPTTTSTQKPVTTTTIVKSTKRPTTTTSTTPKPTTQKPVSFTSTTIRSRPISTTTKKVINTTLKPVITTTTLQARPSTTTTIKPSTTTTTTSTTTVKPTTSTRSTTTIRETTTTKIVEITPKTTQKPTLTTHKNMEDSFTSTEIHTLSNEVPTTEKNNVQYEKISTFIPVSTVAFITERTSQNPVHGTKTEEVFASTTKRSITTTNKLLSISTSNPPSTILNSHLNEGDFVNISSATEPTQQHKPDKLNITTITTQSIPPSTTVSSLDFSSEKTGLSHHSIDNVRPIESNENIHNIPLFDVAQSISQIASDLGGSFGPIPTTSNLLDTTKFNGIDLESKENVEMDIPTDTPSENFTDVTDSDHFVKISTLDPHASAYNKTNNPEKPVYNVTTAKNDIVENVELSTLSTISTEGTTIDPFLSESMDDLLSQVVNQQSQTVVTPENSFNDENKISTTEMKLETTTSEISDVTATSAIPIEIYNKEPEKSDNVSKLPLIEKRITDTMISSSDNTKQNNSGTQIATNENNINEEKNENYVQISVSHNKNEPISTSSSTILNKDNTNDSTKFVNESKDSSKNNEKHIVLESSKDDIKVTTESSKIDFTTTTMNIIEVTTVAQPMKNKFNPVDNSNLLNIKSDKVKVPEFSPKIDDFKKKIQKVNIDEKEITAERNNSWKLISTVSPPKFNEIPKDKLKNDGHHTSENNANKDIVLDFSNENQGLEVTTKDLGEDIAQFTKLCNELAFRYWNAIIENIDKRRSFVLSPYSITSMLAMMFMGARGATSGEMNEVLKLDDMVTFNPHFTLKNISDSIETSPETGVIVSAFVRELYSDKNKGKILRFYKERAQQFYNGHVEEIDFKMIGDKIRRRTNLLVKRYTWGKISEYVKTDTINMQPPLAAFSANIFETDCSGSSVQGRDGEMYFVVSPNVRQRRLVPVPAVVYRSGFLAGYDPVLDATAAALGNTHSIISTLFLMPGQQGNVVHSEDLEALERRLLDADPSTPTWNRLLRTLLPRIGLELQIPRFLHKSVFNVSSALRRMGLKDLFDAEHADLGGLNGPSKDLYLSDMIQSTTFVTCGEDVVGDQHHVETYPDMVALRRRTSRWATDWDEPRDYQRAFHDPHDVGDAMHLPLHLRPRQARLPARDAQPARLRFDRPFLYFVRHNPTGMILYVGRYNPRLLP